MIEDKRERLLAEVLKALAFPTRIKILYLLKGKELCGCEIAPALGCEQSNISRHLAVLTRAGLVIPERRGVSVYYRVSDPVVFELLKLVDKLLEKNRSQLGGISVVF